MAYLGSTQASSVANPPRLLVPRFAGVPASTQLSTAVGGNVYREQGSALWIYDSSHGSSEACDSNFFTDAWYIGIRPGDRLWGCQWTTLGSSIVQYFGFFRSVSTAGANISTGSLITSSFA